MSSTHGLPDFIEIEPTQGCNLRCKMCHVSFKNPSFDYLNLDNVSSFSFLKGKTVSIGAAYEPLIHPKINRLIDILNKNDCEINFVTNGHYLIRDKIPALFDANIKQVMFSVDGITKQSYETVRIGGDFSNAITNVESFISSFSGSDSPIVQVNYTVLRCNMHEVASAPKFWNDKNVDSLAFLAMQVRYDDPFLLKNSLWPIRSDYFNCLDEAAELALDQKYRITLSSAYYQSENSKKKWGKYLNGSNFNAMRDWSRIVKNYQSIFQNGSSFGMEFSCKSPFVAARILFNGDVMLCQNHRVGSLYENSFEDIWYGDEAQSFRKSILADDLLCKQCDYYRFCVNGGKLDLNNIENHFSQHMRNFDLEKNRASSRIS